MTKLRLVLATILLVSACAPSRPPPAAPSPAPPAVAPPSPATDIQRIKAGGTPGSNRHRWGSRFFELRTTPSGVEVRIHDAIDFQGSNMTPEQMPPTTHVCTAWERLPEGIAHTLEALRARFAATANGSAGQYYGRPEAPCD